MKTKIVVNAQSTVRVMLAMILLSSFQPLAAQPSNDDFDNAASVTEPLPFVDFVNTLEATTASDDPDCSGQGPTVWYVYSPSMETTVQANTFGSDYDTVLSVYTGTRGDLVLVGCNDDTFGLQSRVIFTAQPDETYYFMVGAFSGGPGGELTFTVDVAPPPGPPLDIDLTIDSGGSFDKAGTATLRGTATCSRPAFVNVFGEAKQQVGRVFITAFFDAFVLCDGQTAWEATTQGETGVFRGGGTKVSATAFAFDPETGEFAEDSETSMVQLRGGARASAARTPAESTTETASLQTSFPNPFNPQATIRFALPDASDVRLAVYDATGRQVQVLVDGTLSKGEHEVTFEAHDLPSGVYFSRLEVGGKTSTSKMVLMK